MKRLAWFSGIILAIVSVLATINFVLTNQSQSKRAKQGQQTLTIFNWGDYIDPELINKFERQSGYKVDYETFDSNEAMFTKIKQGGTHYDLAIPSDYMIQKMKKAKLLVPLDHKRLTGLKYYDQQFMDLDFDRDNRYSVPYFWGTLGIVYNDKYVQPDEIKTWNDLWQPKWRNSIMLYDSARDVMAVGLASNNNSVNTKNMGELAAAKGRLDALMPNVKAIVGDEIKMYMAQDEAKLALDFSGDAAQMIAENPHLHYVVPAGKGNIWFDNIVMPKTVQNKPAAYAFINFISQPKNAAQNALYNGYATPNSAAKRLLPQSVQHDSQFYPTQQILGQLRVYQDLGLYWTEAYNDLFLEFKMSTKR
ncbi:ABC transporter substrate-binding protein [Weissella diestrammenae]|uniref:ABC transporter substrate-binding protein n=1 Tax=Weissella diestrammenae TaxID=1162633 RepID=A0A7G9T6C1_9LACO|nr:ABC transporter substrate-binding protein [Weissella diestrammenae]MCM0583308.1 ABC transporter substrate-binding protein [Weissella diestrammenae]QNN75646.1 ABC transporter substrate-binding protein [Weissella diestrammenae]